jgi:Xaa-Pro aminopeptidase
VEYALDYSSSFTCVDYNRVDDGVKQRVVNSFAAPDESRYNARTQLSKEKEIMNQRLADLRAKLAAEGLDGMLITRPENLYYLSGFGGGEYLDATMVISAEHAWISTDSRYYEDVKQRAKDFKLFEAGYDRNKVLGEFAAVAKPKVMGFEVSHLTVQTFKDWSKAARQAGFKLKPVSGLVEDLRVVKTPAELEKIKRAVKLTDEAFAHFCAVVKPGMTEKEGAWIIEKYMREHGADKIAFDLIVASGPNGALPHAVPGERPFQLGEPIVVDIGARVDHYHSDLTRTIILGKADEQFHQVYKTVLRAQQAAEKKIKAGIKGKRADAFARKVIDQAGFGDKFGHGLGHGVGLAVHENPRASKLSKDVYRAGMTLTIEPGIYIPGWGGVRIEDLVVIQEQGVEILSQASKEPVIKV